MMINPIKRDIIKNALATVADNMIVTVVQTARSPIVKNKLDFSTAICDPQGRLAGQGVGRREAGRGEVAEAARGGLEHRATVELRRNEKAIVHDG